MYTKFVIFWSTFFRENVDQALTRSPVEEVVEPVAGVNLLVQDEQGRLNPQHWKFAQTDPDPVRSVGKVDRNMTLQAVDFEAEWKVLQAAAPQPVKNCNWREDAVLEKDLVR